MTIDASLEIRKLPPSHISQLSSILESAGQWKKLMAVVPTKLTKFNFECAINLGNTAKYNSDHIRLIEVASQKFNRAGSEILLEEWGCSGRVRPAVGHLFHLLVQAELFRAADYVAEKILFWEIPKRPSEGPAAPISTNLNGRIIEELLDNIDYSSSLLADVNPYSFNNNLDHERKDPVIPQIVVTPEADDLMISENQLNLSQEVSSMIKFSTTCSQSRSTSSSLPVLIAPSVSDKSEISSGPNIPVISTLNTGSNIPNLSSQQSGGNIPNISSLNQQSEGNIQKLSDVNQDSKENSENANKNIDEYIPNITELNQSSIIIPNLGQLLSENEETNSSSISSNLSDITIPNITASESAVGMDYLEMQSNKFKKDASTLPNFSVLIPETRRSSLNISTAFASSKLRQCVSPLPNLTLNTCLPHFAYQELEAATQNFNEEPFRDLAEPGRFLGSGAFGKVFLASGLLDKLVAVKKILLDNVDVVNVDDTVTKQFKNEVEVLSRFHHENLLALVGYSCDGCTYCLLYDYISGGTLKDRLQNVDNKLKWEERLSIALGTSKAISYLHTAFSSPLIHRDIKTANILLDCSNKPKLGDFGITKLLNNQNTNTCTVIGTSAYMAPEALRGDISVKCDTFSFGVVLLELLTSLPTFDESREGNDLVTHVEEQCEDSIQTLLDTSVGTWIKNDINFGDAIFSIATQCLEEKKKRPIMVDVTKMLLEVSEKIQS